MWDALDLPYQLCVSYEVSVVPIASGHAVEDIKPVEAVHTEYGLAGLTEATPDPCRTETVDGLAYRFCPDDPPVLADRIRAVLRARVLDETTEEPMEVDLTLTSSLHGVTPRAAQGGRVGLVGQPARAFPGLDVDSSEMDLRIVARGFLPLDLAGTLGPIAGFPDQFAALDLGDVGMHRAAIALRGRTLQRASLAATVVFGATVSIVGHWPTFPPANVAPLAVMQAPNLINVVPGSYASRAAATTLLQRRDLLSVPGQEKTLCFLPSPARSACDCRIALDCFPACH